MYALTHVMELVVNIAQTIVTSLAEVLVLIHVQEVVDTNYHTIESVCTLLDRLFNQVTIYSII